MYMGKIRPTYLIGSTSYSFLPSSYTENQIKITIINCKVVLLIRVLLVPVILFILNLYIIVIFVLVVLVVLVIPCVLLYLESRT